MRPSRLSNTLLFFSLFTLSPAAISPALFLDLEEASRIVDITYCVGITGISSPFNCASHCTDFPSFDLVTTWNTGVLLSDSCGYIALSHPPAPKRIIVAFRGTYSIPNTVADLTTIPQKYEPYPGGLPPPSSSPDAEPDKIADKCTNCTVHAGFARSWQNTREAILPTLKEVRASFPDYQLCLVGHSLGGAVAGLAALEFVARGWEPVVTTFGEPRLGNAALMRYIDDRFTTEDMRKAKHAKPGHYRRVTHAGDPVPLLPLKEWGFEMHGGEIFISRADLSPDLRDVRICKGDADHRCIAGDDDEGSESSAALWGAEWMKHKEEEAILSRRALEEGEEEEDDSLYKDTMWSIPRRFRGWQLFFAHRDYFWRIGLCIPGGDPRNWFGNGPDSSGKPEL